MTFPAPAQSTHGDLPYSVPPLPSSIRYYDDFGDAIRTIPSPASADVWAIKYDGHTRRLDFGRISMRWRPVIKHSIAAILTNLAPATACNRFGGLQALSPTLLDQLCSATPMNVRDQWNALLADTTCSPSSMEAARSFLRSLCESFINGWSTEWDAVLSTLPGKPADKYAVVRSGEAFLSVPQEAAVIAALDSEAVRIINYPHELDDDALVNICLLGCSYQFGFRPKQIALLKQSDVKLWPSEEPACPAVHLSFRQIKQKPGKDSSLVRRVKRDWTPLFAALYARNLECNVPLSESFFRVISPRDASKRITTLTQSLLGDGRTPSEFRHTAAQRLADAGASKDELAEFLGHSDTETALVYYQNSASQAVRVNRALGISPIYTEVARIAHAGFINTKDLEELRGDQQIAGVPHGFPIAGIGGCAVGQPSCPHNPVLSCYGCRRFMPLQDAGVHKEVLGTMREAVQEFIKWSRNDQSSPAYLQLRSSISNVESIIDHITSSTQ